MDSIINGISIVEEFNRPRELAREGSVHGCPVSTDDIHCPVLPFAIASENKHIITDISGQAQCYRDRSGSTW